MKTLHRAIDTYTDSIQRQQQCGSISLPHGENKKRIMNFCKQHLPDLPLDELNNEQVSHCQSILAQRPISIATGRSVSVCTARFAIKAFRQFCRWLRDNEQVNWTNSVGSIPKIQMTKKDMLSRRLVLPRQSINIQRLANITEQLENLGKLIVGLSVNCAMFPIDLATTEISDFNSPAEGELRWHPGYRMHRHYARTILLWPEVAELVRWGIERAKEIRSERLIVSNNGKPWYTEAGNNPTARFSRWWRKARTNNGGFLDIGQALANNQVSYRLNDLRRVLPAQVQPDSSVTKFLLGHTFQADQAEVLDMSVVQSRADDAIRNLDAEFRPFLDALRT